MSRSGAVLTGAGGLDRTDSVSGATSTITWGSAKFPQILLSLTVNHVMTFTDPDQQNLALVRIKQPAAGGKTFTISDGTLSQAVDVDPAGDAVSTLLIHCPGGGNLHYMNLGAGTAVTVNGVREATVDVNTVLDPADIGAAAAADLTAHVANLAGHLGDPSAAHPASAISSTAIAGVSGTDVQAMLASLKSLSGTDTGGLIASDYGYTGWAGSPAAFLNASALGAGTMYLTRVDVRASTTLTKVVTGVSVAGATLTAGQNFGCLYNSAGTLLAKGDAATAWLSTGLVEIPVTVESGQSLTLGGTGVWVWVGFYSQGTTKPTLIRSSSNTVTTNTGSVKFFANTSGTYTTAPPTTLPALSQGSPAFWAAVI
jgi:hypothetical protein